MSITFNKFCSIENSYREKYIEIIRFAGLNNVIWRATEKIDGANFQFITDGKEVRVASRNNLVDGTFYGCQEVIDKYRGRVLELKNKYFPEAGQIAVYGELYGPGIQSRVNYGPKKDFAAFDLHVDDLVVNNISTVVAMGNVGIPMVPIIGEYISLDEALAVPNDFRSLIFPDAEGDNITEGVVLRPADTAYTGNGRQVIIKNKNEKFSEKKAKKDKGPRPPNPMLDLVEPYVNVNRLENVLSKEGELTHKDFGRMIKVMGEDVISDMIADGDLPEDWKKVEELKPVGKAVSSTVAGFLKKELLPRL